ncbi:MAG TPA: ribonuclease R, partial [Terriglobales bacterium]
MISDTAILQNIERQPKHTAGFKQLVRELGLHGDGRQELSQRLDRLTASGQLLKIAPDRYALPQSAKGRNLVAGRLSLHRDGFGFVIPDRNALDERQKARITGDIFIPPPAVGSAMHGDRVLAEISVVRPDGRAEGRVVRLVARAHPTVVGTFHYARRHNFVTPIDQKVAHEIMIPPGVEYPAADARETEKAGRKKSVHRVLGDEAARRTEWNDLEGVVVDVEITHWPTATQNPRGRVVEIIGYPDDFGV